jgi:hypothetical protein
MLLGDATPATGGTVWDTISAALAKIQIPGFGVPKVERGTVVQAGPGGTLITRQEEGYPVPVATGQIGVTGQASTGTGLMLLGGAVVIIGIIWMMRKK